MEKLVAMLVGDSFVNEIEDIKNGIYVLTDVVYPNDEIEQFEIECPICPRKKSRGYAYFSEFEQIDDADLYEVFEDLNDRGLALYDDNLILCHCNNCNKSFLVPKDKI